MCIEALEEAIARYGRPEIVNTDQGSQFTSTAFTDMLKENCIQISMEGKGQWTDNVFTERQWRSLKYECVYLNAFRNFKDAQHQLGVWINHDNDERPHFEARRPHPERSLCWYLATHFGSITMNCGYSP